MVFGREPEGYFTQTFHTALILTSHFQGIVKKVSNAKVAVFTSALDVAQTETKGTVLIKNADEMLNFTSGEEKHLEKVSLSPSPSHPPLTN
jgi:chaperonin GroEL (HSP60 family)